MKSERTLLLVEDDADFARLLSRRLSRYRFRCQHADNTSDALLAARKFKPSHILLDMKLGEDSGLALIRPLRQLLPTSRLVLLTGYASIASAVDAMRRGADDFLTKPADSQTLLAALEGKPRQVDLEESPMSPERLEWEHLQQALKANQGNISSTARQLGMHRRTLQRKLKKRPMLVQPPSSHD